MEQTNTVKEVLPTILPSSPTKHAPSASNGGGGHVKALLSKFDKPGASVQSPDAFEKSRKKIQMDEQQAVRLAKERAQKYNLTWKTKQLEFAKMMEESKKNSNDNNTISPSNAATTNAATTTSAAISPPVSPSIGITSPHKPSLSPSIVSNTVSIHSNTVPSSTINALNTGDEKTNANMLKQVDTAKSFVSKATTHKTVEQKQENEQQLKQVSSSSSNSSSPNIRKSLSASDKKTSLASNNTKSSLNVEASSTPPPSAVAVATTAENKLQEAVMQDKEDDESTDGGDSVRILRIDSQFSISSNVSTRTPVNGYPEIHQAVKANRLSTSDRLMFPSTEPDYNYDEYGRARRLSLSSVGPGVSVSSNDICRLKANISVRDVLTHFYEVYAPEKLEDVDTVLWHFKGRSEALLYTLECKYSVTIDENGMITPFREPKDGDDLVEDEVEIAYRESRSESLYTELTTNSFKGYDPREKAKVDAAAGGATTISPKPGANVTVPIKPKGQMFGNGGIFKNGKNGFFTKW